MRSGVTALFLLAGCMAAQTPPLIDLAGEWKRMDRDDSRFARPDWDDSEWPSTTIPTNLLSPRELQMFSYSWLRRTVQLDAETASQDLVLTLGKLTENYEVYVNGGRVARVGEFDRAHSEIARPRSFDLPRLGAGRTVSAVRLWRPDVRGLVFLRSRPDRGPYLITGQSNAPREAEAQFLGSIRLTRIPDWILSTALLTTATFLLLIFLHWRDRRELLWLAVFAAAIGLLRLQQAEATSPGGRPWAGLTLQQTIYFPPLVEFLVEVFNRRLLVVRAVLWLAAASAIITGSGQESAGHLLAFVLALGSWLWIVVSYRRWDAARVVVAAGAACILIFLANTVGQIGGLARFLPIMTRVGNYQFVTVGVLGLAFSLLMVTVLIRQFLVDSRDKQRLAAELESARTMQQLLFPANPGQQVEAVYWPAMEVGGDFWQELLQPDGSRLVAVGDVSGKGLKAAMVVSLLIGALRNSRASAPAAILGELNRVAASALSGGFVTAAVARIDGDTVTIANAGHPAPYLDGVEVALEAGLPLGIDPGDRKSTRLNSSHQ